MSYNPAFVSDELEGSVARGSSGPQDGGIVLTSFKALPRETRAASEPGMKRRNSKQNPQKQETQVQGHKQLTPSNGLYVSTSSSQSLLNSSHQSSSSSNSYNYSLSDAATNIATPTTANSTSSSKSPSSSTSSTIDSENLCAAVECRDMRYNVGRGSLQKTILHDINVTVPEGSIYGLLGPSGCGKTTMLRCVIGRIKPKSGYVRVFGYRPNQSGSRIPGPAIGYMPQVSDHEKFIDLEFMLHSSSD